MSFAIVDSYYDDCIPIAVIWDGYRKGNILSLVDLNKYDVKSNYKEMNHHIKEDSLRDRRLSVRDRERLRLCIQRSCRPNDDRLASIYDELVFDLNDKILKSIDVRGSCIVPILEEDKSNRFYVSGPTGCGKSTFCSTIIREFQDNFPDREVYIFSRLTEDEAFDDIEYNRVVLDDGYIMDPLMCEDLQDSIVVLDDIDSIQDKDLHDEMMLLRKDLLQTGRHFNITLFCTTHLMCNYRSTRELLGDCNYVTIFPRSGSKYNIIQYLTRYLGLPKRQITEILSINSRWLCIHINSPQHIIFENGAMLL